MGLKKLIENQTIMIDDHRRGNGEIKIWEDPSADIHIDKITNFNLKGKKQKVRIRVPINSDRPIKIEDSSRNMLDIIPQKLKREIKKALENKATRERFVTEILGILRNYNTILQNEERAQQVIRNLSRHFDLQWTEEKITTYTNEALRIYTQILKDKDNREFYISVDKEKITFAENNGFAKQRPDTKENTQY